MKKLIALMMVLTMMLSVLAACGGNDAADATDASTEGTTETTTQPETNETEPEATEPEATEPEVPASTGSLTILENVWNQFPEEEKFSVYGGSFETHSARMAEDENYQPASQPEVYDMAYAEALSYTLYIPAEYVASIDEAATMTHMMLANNFSVGVVRLTEGTDVEAMAAAVKDALVNNMWMCGIPDTLVVAVIDGSYMLVGFGVNDAMNPFMTHFAEAYPEAEILYNEPIAG